MRRLPVLTLVAAMMLALVSTTFASPAIAAPPTGSTVGPINFENYTLGNINGQQGWSKTGAYDMSVAAVTAYAAASGYGFQNKALRASNAFADGAFGGQAFSPGLTAPAGEGALPYFTAGFMIGTTQAAMQPGLKVSVSPDDGNGGRMSYLRFEDQSDGVHAYFDDATDHALGSTATFNEMDIATLDRGHSHAVEFAISFVPGTGNDVVDVFVDGVLRHTGTTWEDYYRYDPEQTGGGNKIPATSKLLFAARGDSVPAVGVSGGFLIDGVSLSSGRVVPAANPDLMGGCGLNFVLVLDRSGSVEPSKDKVRGAANAFLDALTDTGSSVSLVSFAETATVDQTPIPLTSGANRALLTAKLGGLHFAGSTNWDDALVKADSQLPAFNGPNKPLVVIITDGDPNKWGAIGHTQGSGSGFVQEAQDQAVDRANTIKGKGSHMFALGISGGNDPLRPSALRAISGHDEYPDAALTFAQTDWSQVQSFDELKGRLQDIATDLCGGTVVVNKLVDHQAAGGWLFGATGGAKIPSATTTPDGTASFTFHSTNPVDTQVTETQQPGYGLQALSCMKGDAAVGTRLTNNDGVSLTVGPRDLIRCQFDNQTLPAAIALAKSVDHPMVRSGATVTYTYTVTNPKPVPLNHVAVTDDKCSPVTFVSGDANNNQVLEPSETWIYTCSMAVTADTTNIATATGKTPLGTDVVPFHATAVVDVIGPALTLVKTGPAMAHAGDTVTYGFKVTNTGDTTLENIAVNDNLLGAIGVVPSLASGASVTLHKDYMVAADQVADVVNLANACAAGSTDALGHPLCAQGQHDLDVLHPAITIDKTADPINVTVPNAVTFTYVVKNTGDTPLSSLVVTDDQLGPIGTGSINTGETKTFTKAINISATTPSHNVGTVTAADALGRSVTANDGADIQITQVLGLQLTKPAALPITGSTPRNLLVGLAGLLMGGLLLTATRRRRTA